MRRRIQAALVVLAVSALVAGAAAQNPPEKPDWSSSESPPGSQPGYRDEFGRNSSPPSTAEGTSSRNGGIGSPNNVIEPPSARDAAWMVRRHIEKRADDQGYFTLKDHLQPKEWELTLDQVVRQSYLQVQKKRVVILADCVSEDGAKVTVEFTLKQSWFWGNWVLSSSKIFSVDGVPRWTYKFSPDKDEWVRAPVKN